MTMSGAIARCGVGAIASRGGDAGAIASRGGDAGAIASRGGVAGAIASWEERGRGAAEDEDARPAVDIDEGEKVVSVTVGAGAIAHLGRNTTTDGCHMVHKENKNNMQCEGGAESNVALLNNTETAGVLVNLSPWGQNNMFQAW